MAETEIRINDQPIVAEEGDTLLLAARKAGIYIPALCYHPALPDTQIAADAVIYQNGRAVHNEGGVHPEPCGLCLVEVEGIQAPVRACAERVSPGMVISTESPALKEARREVLKRILSHHPNICITCDRVPRCPPFGVCVRSANVPDRCVACPGYDGCELLKAADHVGMIGLTIPYTLHKMEGESDNPFFDFDPALCIGCTRCVRLCQEVRKAGALGFVFNEGRIEVGTRAPAYREAGCRFCMGCVEICPTGALSDKKFKWQPAADPDEKRRRAVPCRAACPLGIDVPRYIYLTSQRRYDEALAVIEEKLPFPLLCGTICSHPCETECRRAEMDEPVAIRDIKRFAAEHAQAEKAPSNAGPSGKSVAVIGSGPAGLAAAYALASGGGHRVTLFEALEKPGGMLSRCIPRFRLPPGVLESEIQKVRDAGVDIQTGTPVESLGPLFEQGVHAVCVATGAHHEVKLGIEGEDSPGVTGALTFLQAVNDGAATHPGATVAVIGGGNVALDAARSALRLGAEDVVLIYRRSRTEMPAQREEIERAEYEGVRLLFLAAPTRISRENGGLRLHLLKTRLRGKDAGGRARAFPVRGSDFHVDVATIITAVGQEVRIPPGFPLEADRRGRVNVTAGQSVTSHPAVFAAGDAVSGPWNVAGAIASGLKAADAIDRFLGGAGLSPEPGRGPADIPPVLDQDDRFLSPRTTPDTLPKEEAITGFAQVESCYGEDEAVREANRCLRCSLRLDLYQPGAPGNVHTKEGST